MEEKSYIKLIKQNWIGISIFISLIVGWTNLKNTQEGLKERLTRAETQIQAISPVLLQLQTSMARVETTLEFIKLEISKK